VIGDIISLGKRTPMQICVYMPANVLEGELFYANDLYERFMII